MKKFVYIIVALFTFAAIHLYAGESLWHENIEKAGAEAKESDKPMLLNFSGSDWCIWCKKLNKEVLSKSAFESYAKNNLVLVNVDFPQFTSQNDDVKKQNQKLAQTYQVRGFPTVVLLSSDGEEIGRTGYQPGGPEKYIEHIKEIIHKQEEKKAEVEKEKE